MLSILVIKDKNKITHTCWDSVEKETTALDDSVYHLCNHQIKSDFTNECLRVRERERIYVCRERDF